MIETIVISKTVEHCVKNFIAPKIDSFAKLCKDAYNDYMIPQREHFEEYLLRSYEKYSILNTLVLRNQQKNLKDLYIPLTIQKCVNNNRITERIDKYPVELVKEYSKILITDTAGMGKSTLTKFLFLDVIENGHGIPIYIELRRLSKERTILREIKEQLNSLSKDFDSELLLRFIQTGDFVFFLDGYDEIPFSEIKSVTSDIQDFISKANKNIFFMTSRPESSLSCFGDFQGFSIMELSNNEAYELLTKYDKNGDTSRKLIAELKTGRYKVVYEFLKNPLLVSLLFTAYEYKHMIPLKKHIFYRQVYDAYFEYHDLSKGDSFVHNKYSKLDSDDFNKVLRYIAYKSIQMQKVAFEKDILLKLIDDLKQFHPELHFSSSDFLKDIIVSVPVFCIDGNYYRWVHKSLQEYFAALFIYRDSNNQQAQILSTLYNSVNFERYINLLDLYSDIDYSGFRKNIVLAFCKEYVELYKKHYFKSDILKKEDIEYRLSYLFLHNTYMIWDSKKKHTYTSVENIVSPYIKNINHTSYHLECSIWEIENVNIKYYIYTLLLKKYHIIFKEYEYYTIKSCESLLNNTIFKIDVNIGDNKREDYMFYNQFLVDSTIGRRFYLSYEACKNMIKDILQQQNYINLLDGL